MTRRVILTYEEGGYSPRLKMTPFRFVVFKSLTPFDSNCSMWGHGAGTCPREAPSCRYCALSWKLGMGMKIQNARNRFSKVRISIGYAWSADRSIMPIPPPPLQRKWKKVNPSPAPWYRGIPTPANINSYGPCKASHGTGHSTNRSQSPVNSSTITTFSTSCSTNLAPTAALTAVRRTEQKSNGEIKDL